MRRSAALPARSALTALAFGAWALSGAAPAWAGSAEMAPVSLVAADVAGHAGFSLDQYMTAAQRHGFSVSVTEKPSPAGTGVVDLQFSKQGKTADAHGLLQRRWEQKDSISLTTLRAGTGGFVPLAASRVVLVKPPIGDWTAEAEAASGVPAWVYDPVNAAAASAD